MCFVNQQEIYKTNESPAKPTKPIKDWIKPTKVDPYSERAKKR